MEKSPTLSEQNFSFGLILLASGVAMVAGNPALPLASCTRRTTTSRRTELEAGAPSSGAGSVLVGGGCASLISTS